MMKTGGGGDETHRCADGVDGSERKTAGGRKSATCQVGLASPASVASPAFGYAGVALPTIAMNAFAYGWSAILPLRWYMSVLLGQAAHGLQVSNSVPAFAALAALAALYGLLALMRLRAVAGRLSRRSARPNCHCSSPSRPGVACTLRHKWQRLFTRMLVLLIAAPLIYGIYYPQPYLNQILRKLPIAVVDADQSELRPADRRNARPERRPCSVVARARTLADARAVMDRGDAFATVGIPAGDRAQRAQGRRVHIQNDADAAYLFVFRSLSTAAAVGTLSSKPPAGGARTDGSLVKANQPAPSIHQRCLLQPILDPGGGYASYVVPAAFLLILQQTLLVGAAETPVLHWRKAAALFRGPRTRYRAHEPSILPALRSSLSWCLASTASRHSAEIPCNYWRSAPCFCWRPASWARRSAPGSSEPGNAQASLPRHQPAAVFPHRIRLAARGYAPGSACRRSCVPGGLRDQRGHPGQSARRKPHRGDTELAWGVPGHRLFRAGRGFGSHKRQKRSHMDA